MVQQYHDALLPNTLLQCGVGRKPLLAIQSVVGIDGCYLTTVNRLLACDPSAAFSTAT